MRRIGPNSTLHVLSDDFSSTSMASFFRRDIHNSKKGNPFTYKVKSTETVVKKGGGLKDNDARRERRNFEREKARANAEAGSRNERDVERERDRRRQMDEEAAEWFTESTADAEEEGEEDLDIDEDVIEITAEEVDAD